MSERDELNAEMEALINKYGGRRVQYALEHSEWGKAELERLLSISKHAFESANKRQQTYFDEIMDLVTIGAKK